ncbi:hypothetical protein [Brevundimonas sp. Leaf363]|uniref:hypothetical protein n=1 Tax=Brevundimonas sp. Leaf363 TaxID=1736353 RepID=UPI000AF55196|nr:hypothetical protein [Brevundimonas sp. Leaf363]
MRVPALILGLGLLAGACAPYEAMPTSGYQWEQRQQRIERDWRDQQAAPAALPAKDSE